MPHDGFWGFFYPWCRGRVDAAMWSSTDSLCGVRRATISEYRRMLLLSARSGWSNALYLTGRVSEVLTIFDQSITHVNHSGALSEDIGPKTGRLTVNYPQGHFHLALIQTAFMLETEHEYKWPAFFCSKAKGCKGSEELKKSWLMLQ
jgi:hypothetical protein